MRFTRVVISSFLLLLCLFGSFTFGQTALPPISGMARLDATNYVVVVDTKASDSGSRLGVLSSTRMKFEPLEVNWGSGGPANDLESICFVPGGAGQFLAAESGYFEGKFGRIFYLVISFNVSENRWKAALLRTIALPNLGDEIEGMVCHRSPEGHLFLLLGVRGSGSSPGRLVWGRFNLSDQQFKPTKGVSLVAPGLPILGETRDCSDLYLDSSDRLWISAAIDPGEFGPYTSVIYQIPIAYRNGDLEIRTTAKETAQYRLDGYKVEAVSSVSITNMLLSIGTDDESFGGTWRSLAAPLKFQRTP